MNSLTLEESIFTYNELLIRAPSFNSPHLYSPTTRAPSILRGAVAAPECCDRNIGSGGSDVDGYSNVSGEERHEIATREGREGGKTQNGNVSKAATLRWKYAHSLNIYI